MAANSQDNGQYMGYPPQQGSVPPPNVLETEKTGQTSVYDPNSPPILPPIGSVDSSFTDAPKNITKQPAASTGKLRKSQTTPNVPEVPPPKIVPQSQTEPSGIEVKPQRLSKTQRRRSSSTGFAAPSQSQTNLAVYNPVSTEQRMRSSSAQPPDHRVPFGNDTRIISGPPTINTSGSSSRPGSSHGAQVSPKDDKRGRLRRSWLPGARSRSHSKDLKNKKTKAWVLGQDADYNTDLLATGEKVPELWDEQADVFVHLHSRGSGLGPCFKVPTFAVSTSVVFSHLMAVDASPPTGPGGDRARTFTGQNNLTAEDAGRIYSPPPPEQAPHEQSLYLVMPPSQAGGSSELERLVSVRNLFAFLTGQPLVATPAKPTLFKVLLELAGLLREYQFTSQDGASFGDAVNMSFGYLMEQHHLADVRHSREKTIEALVLGEAMQSMDLYNEAFSHAAGKYTAIRDVKSPLWDILSADTRERLERAHFELVTRQNNVNNRLESFDFPALFSGIANSTTHTEYKDVRYAVWRKSFNRMRTLVLGHYKAKFGNWPPKARSKKNNFSESGLNRQVLKILYSDCAALYDLLVDRQNVTTRAIDQTAEDNEDDIRNPHISALRRMLTEFDQSSPPVLPPIPFDAPLLPDMSTIQANYHTLPAKEQLKLEKNLQEYQRQLILSKSYDFEMFKQQIPLLVEFKEMEDKETKGKTVAEMVEQRIGYWLFLYVVIQSLPMLVVDAPNLRYTEGVEYFLSSPPKGHPPWITDAPMVRKRWYEVAGGGGMVELSTDTIEFSIEGIYHRSHCWLAAKQWEHQGSTAMVPPPSGGLSPLPPPQAVFADMDPASGGRSESPPGIPPGPAARIRSGSPHDRNQAYRKSVALGLEPIALPVGGEDGQGPRAVSGGTIASPPVLGPWSPAASMAIRNRSTGNLPGLQGGTPPWNASDASLGSGSRQGSVAAGNPRQGSVGGSTFDDILKDIEKPKKKKSFF